MTPPMKILALVFCVIALIDAAPLRAEAPPPSPWKVEALIGAAPAHEFGKSDGLVQEVWYEGEPFEGKPTRVFAYVGRPATGTGSTSAKMPAMLLIHGGGGRAFKDWAKHWAERGYVALAMDTAGQGPDGSRHDQPGPGQDDAVKFRPFQDGEVREMWTYHAVAAVLRGHGLLKSLPEVDRDRIAVTGISWGGYLTCIVAGLDPALKAAAPVYGCGFLGDNSVWRDRSLAALTEEQRTRWLRWFDPAAWLPGARCPMLFLNGMHDFAYPPDSHRRSYALVAPGLRTVAVRVDLPHGHIWTFGEVDAFIDHAVKGGPEHGPLVRLDQPVEDGVSATAPVLPGGRPVRATLHVTADTGDWIRRQWRDVPAEVHGDTLRAALPAERPLTFFFTATDARGLITSSPYAELGTGENTACQPVDKLEEDFYDWNQRHSAVLQLKETVTPEIVMIGDSITHLWGGEPAEPKGNRGAESWASLFGDRAVLNLGFGWDRTQNVLWRIQHGELDGLRPKFAVIHIGTNNLAGTPAPGRTHPQKLPRAFNPSSSAPRPPALE
jgi:cephalosporin-C deacetylase-like acetyl esterase